MTFPLAFSSGNRVIRTCLSVGSWLLSGVKPIPTAHFVIFRQVAVNDTLSRTRVLFSSRSSRICLGSSAEGLYSLLMFHQLIIRYLVKIVKTGIKSPNDPGPVSRAPLCCYRAPLDITMIFPRPLRSPFLEASRTDETKNIYRVPSSTFKLLLLFVAVR